MSQRGVEPVLILRQQVLERRDEILSALGTSDDGVLKGIDFALLCLLGGESRPTKEELRNIKCIKRHAGELREALTRLTHTGEYFILKQYRDGDEEAAREPS